MVWLRMSACWSPVGAAAVLALQIGCSGETADTWNGEITDSAGVTLVKNSSQGIWAESGTPLLEEQFSVGVATGDPDLEFGYISDLDIGSDGSVFVLDRQVRQIRVLDSAGAALRRIGGPGSGPGELSLGASSLVLGPSDTVFAPDPLATRINVYLPSGEFVGDLPFGMGDGAPVAWAALPTGGIIYRYFSAQWDGLLQYSRSGSAPDTVLRFQYAAPEVEMSGDPSAGTMRMTMNPLAVMPAWTVLEDGRIAVGTTDSYRISVYEPNGDLERVVTLPAARRAMEPADREAIEDLWDQRQRDRGVPDQIRDAISLALPDSYPTFASFAAGPNGTLWVQQIAGPEEMDPEGLGEMSYALLGSRTWDVFDVEGRYLGPIIFPRKLRLLRTIGDFVYGVAQGDFDEDRIIKFRVLGFRMLGEPRSP